MLVRDAITENKTIYRFTLVTGGQASFVLTDKVKLHEGFLQLSTEDFHYSLSQFKDGKNVMTSCNGDYVSKNKFVNKDAIVSYEDINAEDSRYETFKNIIDRCLAEKCNISLPEEKKIILASS
jgi:hypothetical protein